jgi:hypothetical protein
MHRFCDWPFGQLFDVTQPLLASHHQKHPSLSDSNELGSYATARSADLRASTGE